MMSSQAFATYNRSIASVHAIEVAPAILESTVHVLAWGRDIYYVLMQPSQGFDMLGDGFSYAMLSTALIVMTASVVSLGGVVAHARVNAKWD